MLSSHLLGQYRELPPPACDVGEGTLTAVALPGYPPHRLAKTAECLPVFLFDVPAMAATQRPPPIILEHISIQHEVRCRVISSSVGTEAGHYSLIRCHTHDTALQVHFITVMANLITGLPPSPTQADLSAAFGELAELFAAVEAPSGEELQGLWSELFVISRATDVDLMLSSWRAGDDDRYDFALADQRIEVKSCAFRVRRHHFSLEQLSPAEGVSLLVASLFTERSRGGLSLEDLARRVRERVTNSELVLSLDVKLAEVAGLEWTDFAGYRYDEQLAAQSLEFYRSEDIPSVPLALPQGGSQVRFCSDLSSVSPVDAQQYRAAGGLFGAAV